MYNTVTIMQPDVEKTTNDTTFEFTVQAIIGVHHYEQIKTQPLTIRLIIDKPGFTHLALEIEALILEYLTETAPQLLESLICALASRICRRYSFIDQLSLTIKKPDAIKNAQFAFAHVHWTKGTTTS